MYLAAVHVDSATLPAVLGGSLFLKHTMQLPYSNFNRLRLFGDRAVLFHTVTQLQQILTNYAAHRI